MFTETSGFAARAPKFRQLQSSCRSRSAMERHPPFPCRNAIVPPVAIDLGTERINFVYQPAQFFGASANLEQVLHVAKAGVNYRF